MKECAANKPSTETVTAKSEAAADDERDVECSSNNHEKRSTDEPPSSPGKANPRSLTPAPPGTQPHCPITAKGEELAAAELKQRDMRKRQPLVELQEADLAPLQQSQQI